MLVYAVPAGGYSAITLIRNGDAFDVIADIRVGRTLMQFVGDSDLFVSVRNLSQSTTLMNRHSSYPLFPQRSPLTERLRLKFNPGWTASEGDVLEVVATFKVRAGINHHYSQARSTPFIVSTSMQRA